MRPFVGHHELEMHAEELPAEQVVVAGVDDLAEPDRDDLWIAPGLAELDADLDAMACQRIELEEVHHVLAGLAVDPLDRRLDSELTQMIAKMLRRRVKADDRIVAA